MFGSVDVLDVNWEGKRRYPSLVFKKQEDDLDRNRKGKDTNSTF